MVSKKAYPSFPSKNDNNAQNNVSYHSKSEILFGQFIWKNYTYFWNNLKKKTNKSTACKIENCQEHKTAHSTQYHHGRHTAVS